MSDWNRLLAHALEGLDTLESNGTPVRWWSLGGGTALMLQLGHRDSKDVDLFVPDPQGLSYLSPRLATEDVWRTADYEESTNHLKLKFPEGEIDFIASPAISGLRNALYNFNGRDIPIQQPTEIILKKLYHRPVSLKPRDIFDTAVVLGSGHAETLRDHIPLLTDVKPALVKRLEEMPEPYFRQQMPDLQIADKWQHVIPGARQAVLELARCIPQTHIDVGDFGQIRRYARELVKVEPAKAAPSRPPAEKRGMVYFEWGPDVAKDEKAMRLAVMDKHPAVAKQLLLDRFQQLDPKRFDAWDKGGRTPDPVPRARDPRGGGIGD